MEDNTLPTTPAKETMPESSATKAVSPSNTSGSLIQQVHPNNNHSPYFLWLVVLVTLGATIFVGYMAYQQQQTLASYQASVSAYQANVKQWSDQVGVLQSAVQDLRTQASQAPQVTIPTVPSDLSTIVPSSFPWNTAVSGYPSILPSASPSSGSSDAKVDMSKPSGSVIFDDDAATNDTTSLSDGRMTVEDEKNMLESYLGEIQQGKHKTTQPDGLAMFKSRQMSANGSLNYDIFKATTDVDTFYIYVRGTNGTTGPAGWYGPFSSFPGE